MAQNKDSLSGVFFSSDDEQKATQSAPKKDKAKKNELS
jgi:hypothetical protein